MWSNWGKCPTLGPSQGLETYLKEKYLTSSLMALT